MTLPFRVLPGQKPESNARRSLTGCDGQGAKLRVRCSFTQALIDQLVEIAGAAKHAAAFDQKKCLIAKLKALNKIMDERCQIRRGELQELARGEVASFGGSSDDGKHSGKDVVRSSNRAGLQLLPGNEI